jgi:hypothetical protein
LPVRTVPDVNRLGNLVVVAAHQICWPAVTPETVELVIFRLKQYSPAAPLETGVPTTVPTVFPDTVVVVTGAVDVVVVVVVPAFKTHQPADLSRMPLRVDPEVSNPGKAVVEAAHQICWPAVTPETVVLVIFRLKQYSPAAPLEIAVPTTVPVVLPDVEVVDTGVVVVVVVVVEVTVAVALI